jgi:MFS family permease
MTATRSRNPFAVRDFRLLWLGEAVSVLGDQFALIALPWLALVLTGSALALGSVLAIMAIPRALLMLIGGVSVDRLSPRRVMIGSNAVRLVAIGALGAVTLAGGVELWMLYAFALVFGVADAFFYPAQTSIVPELIDGDQLQRANGIVQGTAQASVLVGPVLGVGLVGLPFVSSTAVAAALIAVSGFALGFGNLHGITWSQSRIQPDLMGRVMSVMIMGSVGLVPVSMLVAGAAVQVSLDAMLVIGGIGMAVLCFVSLLSPTVRRLGFVPTYQAPEAGDEGIAAGPTAEPARA